MNELKQTCIDLVETLENALSIGRFDRRVYVEAFGEKAVQTVENQCEYIPDVKFQEFHIQAMINIAYRKGFDDCCELALRMLALCDDVRNEV